MDDRVYILLEEFHHEYTDIVGVFSTYDKATAAIDVLLQTTPHLSRNDVRVKAVDVQ